MFPALCNGGALGAALDRTDIISAVIDRCTRALELTLESEAVTRISSTVSQATSGSVTGTVLNVNASFKFIKVQVTDTNGSTYEETVYCNDSKTTFITAQGSTKQFRDVKEGSVVACYGASTNGAFEATSIIIVK